MAYLNIDTGTGRLRGRERIRSARRPLRCCARSSRPSRISASTARRRRAAGPSAAQTARRSTTPGCPGIGFQQDPIEYGSHTHHTNLDTYERVIEEDVKKAAMIVASAIYHLSMRDEMLPRFAPADMPAPPPRPGAGTVGFPGSGFRVPWVPQSSPHSSQLGLTGSERPLIIRLDSAHTGSSYTLRGP